MQTCSNVLTAMALSITMSLASLSASTSVAIAGESDDAPLFAAYDQVNGADIEIAELGVVQGESHKVRAVAAMVLKDHSAVQQMARDIADDLGITYEVADNNEAAKTHKAAYKRLSGLSGAEFDKAYLEHEVAFHKNAVEAVKTVLIPSTKESLFREHLEAMLPHFNHHIQATLEAANALGYDIE